MAEKLLSIEEAAEYLNISVNTLRWLRLNNEGPKGFKIGRVLRYREAALDEYVLEQERAESKS